METKVCSECGKEKSIEAFTWKKEKRRKTGGYHRGFCKDCERRKALAYEQANRERINARNRQPSYREHNKAAVKKYLTEGSGREVRAARTKQRMQDPKFRLQYILKRNIRGAMARKGYTKRSRTHEIVGCSFEKLWEWLQVSCQSRYGCSIEELGAYHIDHIVPISTANNEEEVIRLNHWFNLQILTPEDNLTKGNKCE